MHKFQVGDLVGVTKDDDMGLMEDLVGATGTVEGHSVGDDTLVRITRCGLLYCFAEESLTLLGRGRGR